MSFAVTPFTKAAITFNEVYKTNKPSHLMPQHLRENTLSRADAEQLIAGLAAVAPHNALDFTRYDHNGLKIRGYGSRVAENPRITRFGKWNHHFAADEFEGAMPDKSQGVGDLYLPFADVVSVPSGMPGTAVHELGHAIDFNAFPKDKAYRRGLAAMYRNFAPTLWTEHAAWRKGNKALLDAFAKNHIPTELALRALINAKGAKKLGLGSYWGGAIGGVAGLGAGVAGMIALNELARKSNRDIYVPGRAVAALVGGITMLGAMGGIGVGTLLARNPYKREKAIRILANRYAQEHGISLEAATQHVESQLNNVIKATAKTPLKKAANFNLQHALVGAGLGGGAGALSGLLAPGKDKDGKSKRTSSAIVRGLLGGALGGAAGGFGGQFLTENSKKLPASTPISKKLPASDPRSLAYRGDEVLKDKKLPIGGFDPGDLPIGANDRGFGYNHKHIRDASEQAGYIGTLIKYLQAQHSMAERRLSAASALALPPRASETTNHYRNVWQDRLGETLGDKPLALVDSYRLEAYADAPFKEKYRLMRNRFFDSKQNTASTDEDADKLFLAYPRAPYTYDYGDSKFDRSAMKEVLDRFLGVTGSAEATNDAKEFLKNYYKINFDNTRR
jgi:hypothetical protein